MNHSRDSETIGKTSWKKPLILIVDDVQKNIQVLGNLLRQEDCRIAAATNGKKAIQLANDIVPDLILLDIMMPDMDGYEVIQHLKANPTTQNIPVFFITALNEETNETKGLDLGAVDYITKPFSLPVVRSRIRTQLKLKEYQNHLEDLVRLRTAEVVETQLEIVYRLALAAEYRDNETGMHIKRLSHFCQALARKAGMDESHCQLIYHTSSMHDVGKIGIPDHILLKKGRLDNAEYEIIKTHPIIGGKILDGHPSKLLQTARSIALTHHEKWDGTGYPSGLSAEQIPIEGRITAICDVYDALTSERPYKKAWTDEAALAEIVNNSGTHFDPVLVGHFQEIFSDIVSLRERFGDDSQR